MFGTRNIEVIEDSSGAWVKTIEGERIDLEKFLGSYHDKEMQKLDVLGDNEELVVDEQDDYKYQANARISSKFNKEPAARRYERTFPDDGDTSPTYGEITREPFSTSITNVNPRARNRRVKRY